VSSPWASQNRAASLKLGAGTSSGAYPGYGRRVARRPGTSCGARTDTGPLAAISSVSPGSRAAKAALRSGYTRWAASAGSASGHTTRWPGLAVTVVGFGGGHGWSAGYTRVPSGRSSFAPNTYTGESANSLRSYRDRRKASSGASPASSRAGSAASHGGAGRTTAAGSVAGTGVRSRAASNVYPRAVVATASVR
jgi:hypothetical protein